MRGDLGSGAARDEPEYGYEDPRAHALAHIRRESLDVFNRLHSVAEDVRFVRAVAEAYPGLPVLRTCLVLCSILVHTLDGHRYRFSKSPANVLRAPECL